jgi:hypothetical protein
MLNGQATLTRRKVPAMTSPAVTTKTPLAAGQTITTVAGPVVISVQCIRPGYAYRLSVARTGFGGYANCEVAALCRSFPDERTARQAARTATLLFRHGMTVDQVVELVAMFTTTAA